MPPKTSRPVKRAPFWMGGNFLRLIREVVGEWYSFSLA
jgi:hypothetical protein